MTSRGHGPDQVLELATEEEEAELANTLGLVPKALILIEGQQI